MRSSTFELGLILLLSKSVSHLKQNQDFKKFWNSESVLQRQKLNLNHNITYIFFHFFTCKDQINDQSHRESKWKEVHHEDTTARKLT